jgi:hypothetical protein
VRGFSGELVKIKRALKTELEETVEQALLLYGIDLTT